MTTASKILDWMIQHDRLIYTVFYVLFCAGLLALVAWR